MDEASRDIVSRGRSFRHPDSVWLVSHHRQCSRFTWPVRLSTSRHNPDFPARISGHRRDGNRARSAHGHLAHQRGSTRRRWIQSGQSRDCGAIRSRDAVLPGVPEMKRLRRNIHYSFEETPNGGRVVISSANKGACDAIHRFLRFQIEEHKTGDPLDVL
jgi:hypothetical protein